MLPSAATMRSRVGLVAQTPTLFASSIFANIALVGGGSPAGHEETATEWLEIAAS